MRSYDEIFDDDNGPTDDEMSEAHQWLEINNVRGLVYLLAKVNKLEKLELESDYYRE